MGWFAESWQKSERGQLMEPVLANRRHESSGNSFTWDSCRRFANHQRSVLIDHAGAVISSAETG
jgi:hypothetical protein